MSDCREAELARSLRETPLSKERIYSGRIIDVERWTVRCANGDEAPREVVLHKGAAAVVPLYEDGTVAMVRQHRVAVDRVTWEIPAGKLDSREEDRLSAIRRELLEETGYTADEWISLGDFHPAPAYSDEYISMYMARGLHPGQRHLDEDEFLDVMTVPLAELVEDVMAGRISDAKTQTAVLKAARLLGL